MLELLALSLSLDGSEACSWYTRLPETPEHPGKLCRSHRGSGEGQGAGGGGEWHVTLCSINPGFASKRHKRKRLTFLPPLPSREDTLSCFSPKRDTVSVHMLQGLPVQRYHACVLSHSVVSRTLCSPRNCSLPGSSVHGFSRQEYWSG